MKYFKIFFLVTIIFSCNSTKQTENNHVNGLELNKTEIQSNNLVIPPSKKMVLGKFDYKKDTSFSIIPIKYANKTIYLNRVVLDSFLKMNEQANKEGLSFTVISGTRNFSEQKYIWEKKWKRNENDNAKENALKILKYSSMPSTSRHHWGTEIDLNSLNNNYFSKGKGLKEYTWLVKNAHKFGFFQPYTSKIDGRTGYNEEKWHWSFKPISSQYLKIYNDSISYEDINGFLGHETAPIIDVITNYVNGIEY